MSALRCSLVVRLAATAGIIGALGGLTTPSAGAATLRGGTVKTTYLGGAIALVDVDAGGHRLQFIVDTGAATSAVTARTAAELGLTPSGAPQTSTTIGCRTSARNAELSGWSVGGVALPSTRVSILNDALAKEKLHGAPVAGLLGSDVLSQFGAATFDLGAGRLVLGGSVAHRGAGIPMRVLRGRSGVIEVVRATIGGETSPFVLDTGSPLTLVQQSEAARLQLPERGSFPVKGAAGCSVRARDAMLTTWSAGGQPLPTTPAIAVREPSLRLSAQGRPFGLIGADTLFGFGRMTLDFTDHRLILGGG